MKHFLRRTFVIDAFVGLAVSKKVILWYLKNCGMYTLSYYSTAARPLTAQEMEALLIQASANNKRDNITGCLIAYMGRFIQVLEGDKKTILALYDKIKKDVRHTDVIIFSEDDIEKRTFPDWGMAYYPIEDNAYNRTEFKQFKRNLLLLAQLSPTTNATALTFWKRMKFLISSPPEDL